MCGWVRWYTKLFLNTSLSIYACLVHVQNEFDLCAVVDVVLFFNTKKSKFILQFILD